MKSENPLFNSDTNYIYRVWFCVKSISPNPHSVVIVGFESYQPGEGEIGAGEQSPPQTHAHLPGLLSMQASSCSNFNCPKPMVAQWIGALSVS